MSVVDGVQPGAVGHDTVVDELARLVALRCAMRVDVVSSLQVSALVEQVGATTADRQRLVAGLGQPVTGAAVVDGRLVGERVAQVRWLAWFPRPLGPRHAVGMPSETVAALHRALATDEATIRFHVALAQWRAELLQTMDNLAATAWGRRRLDNWVRRGDDTPDPAARWAVVAEVVDHHGQLVRGWAHGTDRAALTTHLNDTGVIDVDTGAAAGPVLDRLAATGTAPVRWSVADPVVVKA